MKKLFATLSGLALALALGIANAEEIKGIIKHVDSKAAMLTLQDGTQFSVSKDVFMDDLSPGDEVTVSYELIDGKKVVFLIDEKSE